MKHHCEMSIGLYLIAFCLSCQIETGSSQSDTGCDDPVCKDRPDSGFSIDLNGGYVPLFKFGVFGDPRPAVINDDDGYPEGLVSELVNQIASLDVQFIVGVGDWTYAGGSDASFHQNTQLDALLRAESAFQGRVFHAMGNHECKNTTAVNCPDENESPNIRLFKDRLLPGREHTWYSVYIRTSIGVAKIIFTSTNAWTDNGQGAWLENEIQKPSDYTFVVQHTPPSGTGLDAPGTKKALSIVSEGGPVTMYLFGHSHMFRHLENNAFILGNGGGPLDTDYCGSGCFFGFGVVEQYADGIVSISIYERGVSLPKKVYSFFPDGTKAY